MKHICEKCGTPLDKHTGLCPNCDGDEFVPMSQIEEETDDNVTKKGIIAVFLAIIALLITVTVIIMAVSNGWIGGKEKRNAAKSSYQTYFNETLFSKHGVMDTEHPYVTGKGMFFADMFDLNKDKNDEFVIGYADRSGDKIEYILSSFDYNPNSVVQGANNVSTSLTGVEMNSTVTMFSEGDFINSGASHAPNDFQLYSVEGKERNYIFAERAETGKWECCVYTLKTGNFKEFLSLPSTE